MVFALISCLCLSFCCFFGCLFTSGFFSNEKDEETRRRRDLRFLFLGFLLWNSSLRDSSCYSELESKRLKMLVS